MNPSSFVRRVVSAAIRLMCVAVLAATSLPSGPAAAQGPEEGRPAHIHFGNCDELGEVAYSLSNVGPGTVRNGRRGTTGRTVGQTETVYPVDVSVTTIDVPLEEITGVPTAINIHESADKIQNYIACGNIGGTRYGNTLIIGLGQLNETGYTGIAVLRADEDQTVVTVYLESDTPSPNIPEEAGGGGDGEPTPAFGADAGGEAAVAISGFAFGPATLEIPAGTTVTWTNEDGAPHTVTADDGSFDSGRLDTGASYSYTFDTPGTYTYTCGFHSSMTATIVVT